MRGLVFAIVIAGLAIVGGRAALAENPAPYPGTRTVMTEVPFADFYEDLKAAIRANGLGIVSEACAHCGAKSLGKTIPGNRVVMVFHPRFAVRMLAASEAAGIEAPLRLYLTEQPDGHAKLTYRLPSAVFGAYEVDDLVMMAKELDGIFARVIADATQAR